MKPTERQRTGRHVRHAGWHFWSTGLQVQRCEYCPTLSTGEIRESRTSAPWQLPPRTTAPAQLPSWETASSSSSFNAFILMKGWRRIPLQQSRSWVDPAQWRSHRVLRAPVQRHVMGPLKQLWNSLLFAGTIRPTGQWLTVNYSCTGS